MGPLQAVHGGETTGSRLLPGAGVQDTMVLVCLFSLKFWYLLLLPAGFSIAALHLALVTGKQFKGRELGSVFHAASSDASGWLCQMLPVPVWCPSLRHPASARRPSAMSTSGASLPAAWRGLTVSRSGSAASGLRDSLPLQPPFGLTSRCPAGAVPFPCDVLSSERVLAEPGTPLALHT